MKTVQETPQLRSFIKWSMDVADRLEKIADILERVDNRCMAADGPVTKTRHEITDAEYRQIYRLAKKRVRKGRG